MKSDYTSLCDVQQVISVQGKPLGYVLPSMRLEISMWVIMITTYMCLTKVVSHLKNTIGRYGNGDGQFNAPHSISIIGGVMCIADCGNHRN